MYEYSAKLINVVDGDTLDFMCDLGFGTQQKIRVRLIGIDTPEIFHPSCDEERAHGMLAKEFIVGAALDKTGTLKTSKDKQGKYGRYLADFHFEYLGMVTSLVQLLKQKEFEKREVYT